MPWYLSCIVAYQRISRVIAGLRHENGAIGRFLDMLAMRRDGQRIEVFERCRSYIASTSALSSLIALVSKYSPGTCDSFVSFSTPRLLLLHHDIVSA